MARNKRIPLLLGLLGGGGFSPLTIPGLALWLDARDASTLFQASNGTTPVTADGDVVGYWGDKSGNGRHMLQATTGNKPLFRTGGSVDFDGVDDAMAATFGAITLTAQTAILVIHPNGTGMDAAGRAFTQGTGLADDNTIVDGCIPLLRNAANDKWASFGFPGYQSIITPTVFNAPYLFVMRHSGSSLLNRGNGVDGSPSVTTLNQSVSEFVISRRSGNVDAQYKGLYKEALVFNREVTAAELAALETYLNTKWAVY
jgi:hypothetical protein